MHQPSATLALINSISVVQSIIVLCFLTYPVSLLPVTKCTEVSEFRQDPQAHPCVVRLIKTSSQLSPITPQILSLYFFGPLITWSFWCSISLRYECWLRHSRMICSWISEETMTLNSHQPHISSLDWAVRRPVILLFSHILNRLLFHTLSIMTCQRRI